MSGLYDIYNGLYRPGELRKIVGFLKAELARTVKTIKKKPSLYYLSYLYRNQRTESISAVLGAISKHHTTARRTVFCDVRVGSYTYDNVTSGGLFDNSEKAESNDYLVMPSELEADAFRFALWKLTDARYREALEQFYQKKSRAVHYIDENRALKSRMRQSAFQNARTSPLPEVDPEEIKRRMRRLSSKVRGHAEIKNSVIRFRANHQQKIFCSAEGRAVIEQKALFEWNAQVWVLTPNGTGISQELNFMEGHPDALPEEKELIRLLEDRMALLKRLMQKKPLNSYSGPVLLSPQAAGLFFHEVIGHRLEGSRLLSPDDGSTFRDLRGRQIAPSFIDIIDDPTARAYGKHTLTGHFTYDDEGNPARRVVLVEKGVLRSFLTSASPIPGQKNINGHARAEEHERPISRMGNLFIQNRNPLSDVQLRELFLEEIRRQNKPYGIYVKECLGGETETSSYDFQAFKGEILRASRVFPDGQEEDIYGVDFVGTPLSSLENIMAMGGQIDVDNSYCGAESGMIPVSTIAPAALMQTMELQGKERGKLTQYSMPLPYAAVGKR
ncbi:MAG: hypothetical protein HS115_16480 [Spirochaetales bacterium]|nr:hypothetical protein [Spirochaetales bacterium]